MNHDVPESGPMTLTFLNHANKICTILALGGGPWKAAEKSTYGFITHCLVQLSNTREQVINMVLVLVAGLKVQMSTFSALGLDVNDS